MLRHDWWRQGKSRTGGRATISRSAFQSRCRCIWRSMMTKCWREWLPKRWRKRCGRSGSGYQNCPAHLSCNVTTLDGEANDRRCCGSKGIYPARGVPTEVRKRGFGQDTTEPFAMAWKRISRSFAAPRRLSSIARAWKMPLTTLWAILRPHASRCDGAVSVRTIPWRFTYLCLGRWKIPTSWNRLFRIPNGQFLFCSFCRSASIELSHLCR